jgi:hypothetical protein
MSTKSTLKVVDPVTSVLFVARDPVHSAVAVTFIILPIAFIVISRSVGHFSLTPFHSSSPVTLIHRTVIVT